MAKNTILDWDATASNNTDIAGIPIVGTAAVNNFDNAFREAMAQVKSGVDYKSLAVSKSADYTVVLNDNNAVFRCTAAMTLSLTAAATLGANWHVLVIADGADVIIDPNGSEQIDGATTVTIPNGYRALVFCTGTAFRTDRAWATVSAAITALQASFALGAAVSPTTSAATFTGIPASAKRVTVMLEGLSSVSGDPFCLRLGTTGGLETSGYRNGALYTFDSGVNNVTFSTLYFPIVASNGAGANTFSGAATLTNMGANKWTITGGFSPDGSSSSTARITAVFGQKALSGALSQVSVFTLNGVNFDAGSVNIAWEI